MAKSKALPIFLKAVSIQGFKSFADKVKLELGQGLSVVVGPNGSGKSNVADAVRWVLGEQSAKNLRGSKMEDIIFAGSSSRRPVGMAEVSLIFDNSTGIFPLDFQEVTVTRRVYRDGEGQYFINRAPCRLKDIHELFMDTGAGKEGFSIIGQGRVEEILNLKSEERRILIEEASGITKYRMRKREALKRLDETEHNLERINDILAEIEVQLAPLQEQAHRAKESIALREEQKTLEIQIVTSDLHDISEKLNLAAKEAEELRISLVEAVSKLGITESEILQGKVRLNEFDETIRKGQENSYQLDLSLNQLTQDIRIAEERLRYYQEQITRVTNEKFATDERIKQAQQSMQALETRKRVLLKTLEEANHHQKIMEERLATLKSGREIKNIDKLRINLQELQNQHTNFMAERNNLNSKLATIQQSLEQLLIEKTNLSLQKESFERETSEFFVQIQNLEGIEQKILRDISQNKQELEEIEARRKSGQNRLSLASRELEQTKARYNALKNLEDSLEGYSRGVREVIQAKKNNILACKGLCGTVADLIVVEEKNEIAIETALGGGLQNIVAETEKDAKSAVNYLKNHRLGRATFLPLDVIRGGKTTVPQEVIADSGYVGIAVDLVSFDQKYRNAMESQLGRILVVTDMEAATRVARACGYRARIVTLEGDQVHPGGSLTGGSIQRKGGHLLGRSREIQELNTKFISQISVQKEIEAEVDKLVLSKQGLEAANHDLLVKNQEVKDKLLVLREQAKHSKNQLQRLENEILSFETKEAFYLKESDECKCKQEVLASSCEEYLSRIEKMKTELSLQEEKERETAKVTEELQEQLTQIKVQVAKFEQELKQTEDRLEQEKLSISERQSALERKIQELSNLDEGRIQKLTEIEAFKNSHYVISQEQTNAQGKLLKLRSEREEESVKVMEQETRVNKRRQEQQALEQKLHALELKLARGEAEWETGQKRLQEEFLMTWADAQAYKTEIQRPQLLDKVKKIKHQVEELGPINEAAIEEYPKAQQRFEFLSTQQQDLVEADHSLRELIVELDKTMSERFAEGFKAVNEAFQMVFKELFNGGFAELRLDDPNNLLETGVEIIAQPPGKKPQLLSLLSGGERALTAIALLFALLRVKPSPFCILDEIEASLDDANVSRFAQYIHRLSDSTQFLVISHRKGTMESADVLYGVAMQESGVSKILSVQLEGQEKDIESA